jgi:hypothetical protein
LIAVVPALNPPLYYLDHPDSDHFLILYSILVGASDIFEHATPYICLLSDPRQSDQEDTGVLDG